MLFVGNLNLQATERFWHGDGVRAKLDPEFCDRVADVLLSEPDQCLHRAVATVLAEQALRPGFDSLCTHMRSLEIFRRHRYRRDVVLELARAGTSMVVAGEQWERLALPGNVVLQPPTDYDGLFRLAASAKICVDVSSYFDGVNDRVAINRALCFTNPWGHLRDALGERAGVRFYSVRNLGALIEEVHSCLASPGTVAELGELAHQTVLGGHTWRHRVEGILAGVFTGAR